MKKTQRIIGVMIAVIFLLSACGSKRPEPTEAATVFMNAEFYQKDSDSYESIFGESLDTSTDTLKKEFTAIIKPFRLSKEVTDNLFADILTALKENTSFKVGEPNEQKDTTTIPIEVYGIDQNDFRKKLTSISEKEMITELKHAGVTINSMSDLTTLSDLDAINKADKVLSEPDTMKKILERVLVDAFSQTIQSDTPNSVTLRLKPNDTNKKQWTVVNRQQTIEAISTALIPTK